MRADWSTIRLTAGAWTCPVHGIITPTDGGLVPHCDADDGGRTCMRIALVAVEKRGHPGVLEHAEPRPRTCPAGHPLGPGRMSLIHRGCQCTPAGRHQIWVCLTCPRDATQAMWPPDCGN